MRLNRPAAMLFLISIGFLAPAPAAGREFPAPRKVDPERAAKMGIRTLQGQHLLLYTDLPSSTTIDQLPAVFDAAVPQWAEYFGIKTQQVNDWRMQGYLINDRAKFSALGLLPKSKPDFVNGYASQTELWLDAQPSDYYCRHLLLHEGTHGFMLAHLGGCGPGWYMEGMAELMGTHRWQAGRLKLRSIPTNRDQVPMWGRIKLVTEAYQNGKALELAAVLAIDNRRQLSTDTYAWVWALTTFLDTHPRYQRQFREMQAEVANERFNQQFRKLFERQWSDLVVEWQAFVATLDYGYDPERMAMEHASVESVEEGAQGRTIAADRGWQSTGWLLKAGREYEIGATGSYQIAVDPEPWVSEPSGVTLLYHDGKPLGQLLGALRPIHGHSRSAERRQFSAGSFGQPMVIGPRATLTPQQDAVLYLRVNDSPARLSDNQGTVHVTIETR